jgi:hypothetical protein
MDNNREIIAFQLTWKEIFSIVGPAFMTPSKANLIEDELVKFFKDEKSLRGSYIRMLDTDFNKIKKSTYRAQLPKADRRCNPTERSDSRTSCAHGSREEGAFGDQGYSRPRVTASGQDRHTAILLLARFAAQLDMAAFDTTLTRRLFRRSMCPNALDAEHRRPADRCAHAPPTSGPFFWCR